MQIRCAFIAHDRCPAKYDPASGGRIYKGIQHIFHVGFGFYRVSACICRLSADSPQAARTRPAIQLRRLREFVSRKRRAAKPGMGYFPLEVLFPLNVRCPCSDSNALRAIFSISCCAFSASSPDISRMSIRSHLRIAVIVASITGCAAAVVYTRRIRRSFGLTSVRT